MKLSGQPLDIVGRDADDMETAQALRESEARFRTLTQLSCEWYWEQDKEGRFTRVSDQILEMSNSAVMTPTERCGLSA